MNYLDTTQSSVQFTNANGVVKTITKNYIWYRINDETITFLVLDDADPGGDGTCFFTCLINDLTVNGETYTKDTIAEALDDIFEPVDIADVYTKGQIDELLDNYAELDDLNEFIDATELAAALADYQPLLTAGDNITIEGNVISATGGGGSITIDSALSDSSTNAVQNKVVKAALDAKANSTSLATVATSGSYNDLTNKPTIPEGVVVDSALSTTSENAVQNKVVKAALDAKANSTDIPSLTDYSTTSEMNAAISSAVSGKADTSAIPTKTSDLTNDSGFLTEHQSLAGLFKSVAYDSATKRINFSDNTNTVVGYVDASDFVKDGMVQDVKIENGYLVIDFNTDSGIEDISIPVTDIFNASNYYTKTEVDTALGNKADSSALSDYYTKTETDTALGNKQDTLVSGTNIKTINNQSILGDGDITIEGGSTITIDSALSDSSENAVQNKVVKAALDLKADSTDIPSLGNYSTTSEMNAAISSAVSGKADSSSLATVATSGSYNDLSNLPTIPAAQVQSDWNVTDTTSMAYIANKPTIPSEVTVDQSLDAESTNAVSNSAVSAGIQDARDDVSAALLDLYNNQIVPLSNNKQDKLTAGDNITIDENNVISATGGSSVTVDTEITESSQNPVTSAAIYAALGDVEQALATINGTA